eukprot:CAMPEP_0185792558 /NCGR_PEP_ID=MMETSP1174-20130828/159001_1 /TAXON_ID=35687 /ORGANISM="Dictyocha speculum, Strain CCMP1381" /LENGTH=276 /DNA_ID=CAMNT_0028487641 /DNA_START=64 /DNA_END=894 /DNA_ORIENTATION=+
MPKKKGGFLCGAVAGACKVTVTMPLDVFKVQMQLHKSSKNPQFRSMTTTARSVFASDGLRGLYAGFTPALLNQTGKVSIQFGLYESWKSFLERGCHLQSSFMAGLLSGVTEAVVWTTPWDRIKIHRQAEIGTASRYRNVFHQCMVMSRHSGPSVFYVGWVPTAVRQGIGQGVKFATFDRTKELLSGWSEGARAWHSVVAGAVCGAASALANNPLDMVKSQLQAGECGAPVPGAWLTMTRIVTNGGIAALYHGMAPRLVKICVGQAIAFGIYDNFKL